MTSPREASSAPARNRVADDGEGHVSSRPVAGSSLRLLMTAGATLLLPLLGGYLLFRYSASLESMLATAPILFIASFVLLGSLLAAAGLLPSHALAILAGFAWGLPVGLALTMAALVLGAVLARLVAADLLGSSADAALARSPRARRLADSLGGRRGLDAAGFVAAIRISPLFPYAFTGLIFSAARVRMAPFLLGTFCGLLPRTGLSVGIGAALAHFDPDQSGGWWSLGVALAAAGLGMAAAIWFGKRLLGKNAETSGPRGG